jgi:energy-coupling factor transporter ATP-binding protein EcfA2
MFATRRIFVNSFGFSPSFFRGRSLHTLNSTLILRSHSLAATVAICKTISSHLKGGDVVQLVGKVGAGKSAVARAIIRAILRNDDEVVPSPTFSLALSYPCMPTSYFSLSSIFDNFICMFGTVVLCHPPLGRL